MPLTSGVSSRTKRRRWRTRDTPDYTTMRAVPTEDVATRSSSDGICSMRCVCGRSKEGAGPLAALISRAIGGASRIAAAAGGEEKTLFGPACYGDLLASITQSERPEVNGREEAMKAAPLRVEALELIPRVARWAEVHGVRAPIFRALSAGVTDGKKADSILSELMTLPVEVRA
jgi:glycerol-3-phosphate dehydrogenase